MKAMKEEFGISTDELAQEIIAQNPNYVRKRGSSLTPVVIVAPLTGSQIWAHLQDAKEDHWFCSTTYATEYQLWINPSQFYPFAADCFFTDISLQYNRTSFTQSNHPGVYTEIPSTNFGLDALTYLEANNVGGVWNDTVDILEKLGYEPGKNLWGFPYDWRVTPVNYYEPAHFPKLKNLIENAFNKTGKKVFVTGLSMGCPYFASFLNNFVDKAWKDKYLQVFVSFDGAFGGSLEAIMGLIADVEFLPGFFTSYESQLRSMANSFGSFVWMCPWTQIYGSHPFVNIAGSSYTASEFAALLSKYTDADEFSGKMLLDMESFGMNNLSPLEVETHLIHGFNVSTAMHVTYNNAEKLGKGIVTMGDGDETVPIQGLTYLAQFNSTTSPVYTYPIKGMIHGTSVHNPDALRYFLAVLSRTN
eukprot:TRINITY_DN11417_c0_g1_i1.p1 TRINITY_DN11417_c0_g1~~TRINITY_DN11417_c0_g1_i1.p1  ORF type:complete len:472 (+),score=65.89 TRINITY_DN11417_c0_g1_i1:167-1417(+)